MRSSARLAAANMDASLQHGATLRPKHWDELEGPAIKEIADSYIGPCKGLFVALMVIGTMITPSFFVKEPSMHVFLEGVVKRLRTEKHTHLCRRNRNVLGIEAGRMVDCVCKSSTIKVGDIHYTQQYDDKTFDVYGTIVIQRLYMVNQSAVVTYEIDGKPELFFVSNFA